MALFRTVSEKEATGKVKKVYRDIMATKKIDFVPNFWKAMSINRTPGGHLAEAEGRDEARQARSAHQGDHRPRSFDHQQLRVLNPLPQRRREAARAGQRGHRRNCGRGGDFQRTNRIANAYQVEPDVTPSPD